MSGDRVRVAMLGCVSFGLIIAGVLVHRTAPPMAFGTFSYSPLPDEVPVPSNPSRTARQRLGMVLAGAGLTGAAVSGGYALGRRSDRSA